MDDASGQGGSWREGSWRPAIPGGADVRLDVSSGCPEIVAGNGRRLPVTEEEAVAFQVSGTLPSLVAQLSGAGPGLWEGDEFGELRAQVPGGLSVLLDTTTARNALFALKTDAPSPLALLDLAALSTALVCFDNVLVQPPGMRLPEPGLGLQALEQAGVLESRAMWSVCAAAGNRLRADERRRRDLEHAWSDFLRWPLPATWLDPGAWNFHQDSPRYWDGIVAGYYMEDLLAMPGPGEGSAAFLGIQTMRTMVNYELAARLGIPYLAASFRAPVLSLLIRENHERQLVIDRLIQELAPPPAGTAPPPAGPYAADFSAPFILGLALERMRVPSDYWQVIAGYRSRLAPLRHRLRADQETWDGRAGPYTRQLLRDAGSIPGCLQEGEQATVDAGAALVAGALGGAAGVSAGLGLKLLALLHPVQHARTCYRRWFRPELYLLTSLASEARQLRAIDKRVEAIWDCRWDSGSYRQLDMLSSANPAPLLQLGALH